MYKLTELLIVACKLTELLLVAYKLTELPVVACRLFDMDNDGNRDILITNNDINHDLTELDFVIVLPMKSFKKLLLLAENKR